MPNNEGAKWRQQVVQKPNFPTVLFLDFTLNLPAPALIKIRSLSPQSPLLTPPRLSALCEQADSPARPRRPALSSLLYEMEIPAHQIQLGPFGLWIIQWGKTLHLRNLIKDPLNSHARAGVHRSWLGSYDMRWQRW